jgi:hypothetical protein
MRRSLGAAPSMRGVSVLIEEPLAPPPKIHAVFPRRRVDRVELGLLGAFAAVSVWVLALDLWQVVVDGRVWTGTDGVYITDQMQYLGWIVSASHHLLVGNLFVLHPTPADYFQPAIALSGGLVALGLSPTLALLLWKPVAVVAMFLAARAYAHRALPEAGPGARQAVIALTLFYGSFAVIYGQVGVVGDLFPGFLAWGYPFALLGIAAGIFALLAHERARTERRLSYAPGLLGALASLLHPWQGEVLLLVVLAAELGDARSWQRLRSGGGSRWRGVLSPRAGTAVLTLALTGLPLLYYGALDHFDLSWQLGREASKHAFPGSAIALALAPLALVAVLGLRGRAGSFLTRATRLWPLAIVAVYFQSGSAAGATPLHAFDGITLPLAVLAVQGLGKLGWERLPRQRLVTWLVLLVATVPATVEELSAAQAGARPTSGNANFITRDERSALDFLRHDPTPGGVFTRFYLGSAVPGRTGRRTYVGDCIWSEPNCPERSSIARDLLAGRLPVAEARQVIQASHARFILSDCGDDSDLSADLGPLIQSVHHFGCATVYEVTN